MEEDKRSKIMKMSDRFGLGLGIILVVMSIINTIEKSNPLWILILLIIGVINIVMSI